MNEKKAGMDQPEPANDTETETGPADERRERPSLEKLKLVTSEEERLAAEIEKLRRQN